MPAPAPSDDGSYQGRPIAQTCSYLGADWLDRPERAEREQPERVLDALHLDPHATVADVGAGTGYFSLRLARRVARVLATDLQPEMLALLAANARRDRLTNIETIRGGDHDAGLPAGCCDLVLLVDVYHELSDPPSVIAGIKRALAPHGRLVLVEYRGEDPAVPIKPEHKMTLPQLRRELAALGFGFVESLEFLPEQTISGRNTWVMKNALNWFEIPVGDMDRAVRCYETLLGAPLRRSTMPDGMPYAVLPYEDPGVGGALAGDATRPRNQGIQIYLNASGQLDAILLRAPAAGAKVVVGKTPIGPDGFIAILEDSEGNRIGFNSEA